MTSDAASGWERDVDRTYTPAGTDGKRRYVTYRHDSEDVRLRVAPASLEEEGVPGYTLRVTTYPELDIGESKTFRRVLTFSRCDALAREFMELFSANYDGPGTLETALEYAIERTKAPEAFDGPVVTDPDDE